MAPRKLQFENDQMSIWKTIISPGSPLPSISKDRDRLVIALHRGEILQEKDHSPTHEPIEVMIIEVKKKNSNLFPSIPLD